MLLNAVGGRIVTVLETLEPEDLGTAGLVEEVTYGTAKYIEFTECPNPKSVTILLRGGTRHLLREAERIMMDALIVVRDVIEDGKVVYGAGGIEVELAKRLREYAEKLGGSEKFAVEAFATALEEIPRQLAENAGFRPAEVLAKLREVHERRGKVWFGVDVNTGEPMDAKSEFIVEPIRVKEQYIKGACDLAELVLSVDDVIVARVGLIAREEAEKAKGEFAISE
jgi:chaperonin GroEL (HSP60 family)